MLKLAPKYIKKIYKTLLIVLLGVLLIPGVLSLLLFLPGIQTPVAKKIVEMLSRNLNTEISVGRVSVSPLTGIYLTDFIMLDRQNDTLLFSKSVRAGIEHFSFRKKNITFGKVRIQQPSIKIQQRDNGMNYSFLFDSAKTSDDSLKWQFAISGLTIDDGKLLFSHAALRENGIALNSLYFDNVEMDASIVQSDSISVEISSLHMPETNGFEISDLSALCEITKEYADIRQLVVHTTNSRVNVKQAWFSINKEIPAEEKTFIADIREIYIDPNDVKKVWSKFPDISLPIKFWGLLQGSINNLKGKSITFEYGNVSNFTADFDVNDLSNFNDAFVYADVKSMTTNIADIEMFLSETEKRSVKLPPVLHQLGIISYKGNFTGFVNDMVSYGTFKTGLGSINTDVGLKLNADRSLIFAGLVETDNFKMGQMLGAEENVGAISLNMEVKGSHEASGKYFAYLDAKVSTFEFNKYRYNNIALNGLLTNQRYDGNVVVNDPNGKLDFNGKVDISDSIPVFNFYAIAENVHLERLNILPKLKGGVLSMIIDTNFEGSSFDDLIGEISLRNSSLYMPEKTFNLDSLVIKATRAGSEKRITLESDFIEGELTGQYYFRNFGQTVNRFLHNYLPAYNIVTPNSTPERNNNFDFSLRFKKINSLASLFLPDISISNRGFVNGNFNSINKTIAIEGELEHFGYKNISAQDVEIKLNGNGLLTFVARAGKADVGDFVDIYNFSVHQSAGNNALQTNIFWSNWGDVTYSGSLYSNTNLKRDSEGKLSAHLNLQPSTVIIADTVWDLLESQADFYEDGFRVSDFRIEHGNEFLALSGFANRETADSLMLTINQMDLNQFFKNSDERTISMSGIINGELTLRDLFRAPMLSGNAGIKQFVFNRSEIGTISVNSAWSKEFEAMTMTAQVIDKERMPLYGFGLFHPKEQNLDFMFDADSLSIAFLNPIIENVLQNVTGNASGKLYVKGTLSQPVLTGNVRLNESRFYVDILNTTYTMTDSVAFYAGEINFQNMTVKDLNGRSGKFDGSIYHDSFSDAKFNLRLEAYDMLLMNTRHKDNPLYYGTIYGDGTMSITGTTDNTDIAINGRTRRGTRFFIPVRNNKTANESSFINFASASNSANDKKKDYAVDASGAKIDIDIAITPDAEMQIIFDEHSGDLLRSSGTGDIQIRIDRAGDLRLFGDYRIDSGDYLFSLENIFNKEFVLDKGGSVKFDGDPYDAMIDITAIYKLRASMSDLSMLLGNEEKNTGRVAVNCKLMLSDRLQLPAIKFDLEMPTLDKSRESLIRDMISTEEEMNRQIFSLLLLNRFYVTEYLASEDDPAKTERSTAIVTTTEVLSTQISRWVSTISDDIDFGVAYRPGDDYLTSDEFEVALSTRFLDNKVTLNGNVGYGQDYQNASKMIADFDLDVKLNNSGTIRAKAYNRTNDQLYYTTPTTQGIGISFKEEFDSFGELIRKYRDIIFRRKKRKNGEETVKVE
ncbi:MAG: translocation/assembly module TamB [Cytophagaceae bacterium]|jgi:hypothetical protein|nr:translocation/assembly module TamB [Cytophagaceae bacterium]